MSISWDDLSVIVTIGAALILNLACHNDPMIVESVIKTAGRRLIMTAQALLVFRIGQVVIEYGGSSMSKPILFTLLLWGFGSIMSSIDHIAKRWGRDISELLKPSTNYERRNHPRESTKHPTP
jgi:hypothetical protein